MRPEELDKLADLVVDKIEARGVLRASSRAEYVDRAPLLPPALVPRRLTVEQFAVCIGKCPEVVRRRIRARFIDRQHIEGRPYRIDRAALAKFKVPVEVAAERLAASAPATAATPAPSPVPSQA